jgi:hypothetical protein
MKRNPRIQVLVMMVGSVTGAPAGAAQPTFVANEFIFTSAPFPSCHASTIVETESGQLLVAWFGGTKEGQPDVGIWLSRHVNGYWTAPAEVANGLQADGKRNPCWNPVLFQPKDGPLMLFYKVGPSPSSWWGMLRTSDDDGRSWSAARRLPDGILGPIKNKPVQLANREIVCPSSSEDKGWRVHFERSRDGGRTWSATAPVNDGKEISAIQPSILLHGDRLQAVGRTKQGKVFEVWSGDDGKTWGKMTLTELPNPNSGTDAVTLRDGRHLLVYNHTSKGRTPLNVAVSPSFLNSEGKPSHSKERKSRFRHNETQMKLAVPARKGIVLPDRERPKNRTRLAMGFALQSCNGLPHRKESFLSARRARHQHFRGFLRQLETGRHRAVQKTPFEDSRSQTQIPRHRELHAVDRAIHGDGEVNKNLPYRPIAQRFSRAALEVIEIGQNIIERVEPQFAPAGNFFGFDWHFLAPMQPHRQHRRMGVLVREIAPHRRVDWRTLSRTRCPHCLHPPPIFCPEKPLRDEMKADK